MGWRSRRDGPTDDEVAEAAWLLPAIVRDLELLTQVDRFALQWHEERDRQQAFAERVQKDLGRPEAQVMGKVLGWVATQDPSNMSKQVKAIHDLMQRADESFREFDLDYESLGHADMPSSVPETMDVLRSLDNVMRLRIAVMPEEERLNLPIALQFMAMTDPEMIVLDSPDAVIAADLDLAPSAMPQLPPWPLEVPAYGELDEARWALQEMATIAVTAMPALEQTASAGQTLPQPPPLDKDAFTSFILAASKRGPSGFVKHGFPSVFEDATGTSPHGPTDLRNGLIAFRTLESLVAVSGTDVPALESTILERLRPVLDAYARSLDGGGATPSRMPTGSDREIVDLLHDRSIHWMEVPDWQTGGLESVVHERLDRTQFRVAVVSPELTWLGRRDATTFHELATGGSCAVAFRYDPVEPRADNGGSHDTYVRRPLAPGQVVAVIVPEGTASSEAPSSVKVLPYGDLLANELEKGNFIAMGRRAGAHTMTPEAVRDARESIDTASAPTNGQHPTTNRQLIRQLKPHRGALE